MTNIDEPVKIVVMDKYTVCRKSEVATGLNYIDMGNGMVLLNDFDGENTGDLRTEINYIILSYLKNAPHLWQYLVTSGEYKAFEVEIKNNYTVLQEIKQIINNGTYFPERDLKRYLRQEFLPELPGWMIRDIDVEFFTFYVFNNLQ